MVTPAPPASGEIALARAVLYRLAAHAFRHPGAGWHEEWDEIARGAGAALEVLAQAERACARSALADAFDLLWAASRDLEHVRREHGRLIGPSPRAGTTPYETEWTGAAGEILQYHLLADLAGFYRAFGLELADACDERHDHLSIELCFLAFLCVREAEAEARGEADGIATVRAAQRAFLEEHVLAWADSYCARVERAAAGGFHGRAAALLAELLRAERRRFGLAEEGELRELSESQLALEDCCVGCEHARGCVGPAAHAAEPG